MPENLMSETLYMNYADDENDTASVSVSDPLENLEGETVLNAMNTAIEHGVLLGKKGQPLTVAVGAYIRKVTQTTLF